jgi:hypothetical protein
LGISFIDEDDVGSTEAVDSSTHRIPIMDDIVVGVYLFFLWETSMRGR